MNPANRLEKALFENTKKALKAYRKMTGIGRAFHVPESFVQIFVALNTAKTLGIPMLPEATRKKILEVTERKASGPIPANFNARYDLLAFFKNEKPWAAIELKRANSVEQLIADKKKLQKFLSGATGKKARRGYLLAFTGAKTAKSVKGRIEGWMGALDAHLLDGHVEFLKKDKRAIGIALYRLKKKKGT